MAALDSGPCQPWEPVCITWPVGASPSVTGAAVEAATEILWERSGRRFGLCTVALRPCKQECWPAGAVSWLGNWLPTQNGYVGWGWPYPALLGGQWYNLGCSSCGDHCSCTSIEQVRLPGLVAEVSQVKVDGVVLAPSAYRVDDYQYLVRIDGGRFPTCNDLNHDDTVSGTWSVTASYGEVVPQSGSLAVAELALELVKACVPGSGCKLPGGTVTEIQRQGVTKKLNSADVFPGKSVGLRVCDLFIETYNPTHSKPAAIFDMDGGRARQVGT